MVFLSDFHGPFAAELETLDLKYDVTAPEPKIAAPAAWMTPFRVPSAAAPPAPALCRNENTLPAAILPMVEWAAAAREPKLQEIGSASESLHVFSPLTYHSGPLSLRTLPSSVEGKQQPLEQRLMPLHPQQLQPMLPELGYFEPNWLHPVSEGHTTGTSTKANL